jgi:UDP-glucose 4-epimerase
MTCRLSTRHAECCLDTQLLEFALLDHTKAPLGYLFMLRLTKHVLRPYEHRYICRWKTRSGSTFDPSAKATSSTQIINSTKRLSLLGSSTKQGKLFCLYHQPKHSEAMRRSTSYSPYSSPSPSISPVSSRSSISSDDLDSDFTDLHLSQDVDAKDYILVIGGLGFIGSHTTLELLKEGYNVIVVDNMSNSHYSAFSNIQRLASKYWECKGQACPHLKLHKADYRSHMMRTILGRYLVQDPALSATRLCHITGVIHFAAYKSVEESTKKPLQYYQNNLSGLVDLLAVLDDFGIHNFVFSSSATVYGSTPSKGGKPVREEQLVHFETMNEDNTTLLIPGVRGLTSPYGRTKYFGEAILADLAQADPSWRITALRYFNPVGCEPSGTLAEDPRQKSPPKSSKARGPP